jgi:hypothetical protein
MTTATANPAAAGSDSASQTLSLDDAASLDFHDPEEDNGGAWRPDAEEKHDAVSLEKAAENLKTDDEGDEPAGDTETGANEADEADDGDKQPILMKGGEQVTLGELKLGYMRDKDYRHKTQALGNSRRSLESTAARVLKSVDAVAGFLAQQLPEEPSRHLAMTDPGEYTRRKAMFDAGIEQIQAILSFANDTKQASREMTAEQLQATLASENAALIEAFPALAKPDLREKFFADAFRTGQDFGFSPDEMREFNDHRYFKVMHWAMKGLEAERAREKAMSKLQNAPPITPKARQAGKTAGNRDAMRKLTQTGSIHDAVRIDF